MDGDDAVIESFLKRLDSGEMDGHFNFELGQLSYDQLMRVKEILAARAAQQIEK